MPAARNDEQPEYPFAGPFPGLQSEVAPSQIGNAGFAEVQNLIFRNSRAFIVPQFTPLTATPISPSHEPVMGFFDFYDVDSNRHSGIFTPTKMYEYNGSAWIQITGPAGTTFTGTAPSPGVPGQFFQTAVLGYKLFFSQQSNVIQVYDGLTQTYSPADTRANNENRPCKYLMELGFHLIAANTMEGNQISQNRVRWSGVEDGTSWVPGQGDGSGDFTSGQADIFNNLGPINGMCRLFQTGYLFQQWGVTQVVPTGQGLAPFQFISMGAYAKGNILPYSLAAFGELIACYVSKDDVYVFDGTSSQPIGQRPIDGNRRLGARARIFSDLTVATQSNIFGYIQNSAQGNTYQAYWLFLPSLSKAWVYYFDESSWTQILFPNTGSSLDPIDAPGMLNGPASVGFSPKAQLRIEDLTGLVTNLSWTSLSLRNTNPLMDTMVIADNIDQTAAYMNFGQPAKFRTAGSINTTDGWYVRSGPLDFDDNRHEHTVNKVRLVLTDVASPMTFFLRLSTVTAKGTTIFTPTWTVNVGRSTGTALTIMVDLRNGISGQYITWELSGPQGVAFELVEITPYPITGGEIRWDSDFGSISSSS